MDIGRQESLLVKKHVIKAGISSMDITEKIYSHMKSERDKNGFVPTVNQLAEEFNVPDHEIRSAIEQLEKAGRIKVTSVPSEVKIEFVD